MPPLHAAPFLALLFGAYGCQPTQPDPVVDPEIDTEIDTEPDTGTGETGAAPLTPDQRAEACLLDPDDPRCVPSGEGCASSTPLLAHAWQRPRHWPADATPAESTLIAAEELSIFQGGDPECDWREDNASPDCYAASGRAHTLDELAARVLAQPEGERAIVWRAFGNETLPHAHAADALANGAPGIWWDTGAAETAEVVTAVMAGLKARGVTLDWLHIDVEWGLSNWSLGTCDGASADSERERWAAILADRRFPEVAARLGANVGFEVDADTPATEGLCPMVYGGERYLRWNAEMNERAAEYYRAAFITPAVAVFPALRASNYGFAATSPTLEVPDYNGHRDDLFGDGATVGTHQAPFAYGWMEQLAGSQNPAIDASRAYEGTPFNALRLAVNTARSHALADPGTPMSPWIAPSNWVEDFIPLGGTSLWPELVLHVGMLAPERLLYWNNSDTVTAEADEALDNVLQALNRLASCADRESLDTGLADWFAPHLVSGVRVGDAHLWRVTAVEFEGEDATVERRGLDIVVRAADTAYVFPTAWESAETGFEAGLWIVQDAGAAAPFIE